MDSMMSSLDTNQPTFSSQIIGQQATASGARTLLQNAIKPGYDSEWNTPNFLDREGNPVPGIYADVDNDDYHAIPALSSSKLKKFAQSPALYYREYVAPLSRAKSASTATAFMTGTVSHGLILEPERCADLYWYHLNPIDYPQALHTVADLKAAIEKRGLKPKGTLKSGLIEQLLATDPAMADQIFDVLAHEHLMKRFRKLGLPWMKPNPADYPEALLSLKDYESACTKKGLTPVSDDLDDLYAQLIVIDPTLVTHHNLQAVHEARMMTLPACIAYMNEFVLDPITYQDAHRARDSVRRHMRADSLLRDGIAELTMIAQDPETGMFVKAKFDWLRYDLISVDLKTTRDTNPDRFTYQARDLGYDLQDAFYTHVAKLLGIQLRGFSFVCVEFADMDNCEVFEFSERVRVRAENNRRSMMQDLQFCKSRDFWYGYNPNQTTMVLDW